MPKRTLKERLVRRISACSPGDKLPGEVELSEEYSVSRMTMNKVLTKLADEGLVYRRRKAGTFVSGRPQPTEPLYILIPFPGFLEKSQYGKSCYRLINALHTITLGQAMPLIIVPVTTSNDENDINTEFLAAIKPRGTVVCTGFWYHNAFPWLLERQCKVIYLNNQTAEDVYCNEQRFCYITLDMRHAAGEVVRQFKRAGRKNPVFLPLCYHNRISRLSHPFIDGWRRGMERFYPQHDKDARQIDYFPAEESVETLRERIRKFLDTNECDAIFTSNNATMEVALNVLSGYELDVPRDVVMLTHENDIPIVDDPVAYFDFPVYQIAGEIVNCLRQPPSYAAHINACFHNLHLLAKQNRKNTADADSGRMKSVDFNVELAHTGF